MRRPAAAVQIAQHNGTGMGLHFAGELLQVHIAIVGELFAQWWRRVQAENLQSVRRERLDPGVGAVGARAYLTALQWPPAIQTQAKG